MASGRESYLARAREYAETTKRITKALTAMPGISVRCCTCIAAAPVPSYCMLSWCCPVSLCSFPAPRRCQLLGSPDAAIIAFTSTYDIFSLVDRVHKKGGYVLTWSLSRVR